MLQNAASVVVLCKMFVGAIDLESNGAKKMNEKIAAPDTRRRVHNND
jgi:hypothetical protein